MGRQKNESKYVRNINVSLQVETVKLLELVRIKMNKEFPGIVLNQADALRSAIFQGCQVILKGK